MVINAAFPCTKLQFLSSSLLPFSCSYSYFYGSCSILVILLPLCLQAWRCQELPTVVSLYQLPLTFANSLFDRLSWLTTCFLPRPCLIHRDTTIISYSPVFAIIEENYHSVLFCGLCIGITYRSSVLQLSPLEWRLKSQLRLTTAGIALWIVDKSFPFLVLPAMEIHTHFHLSIAKHSTVTC